MIKEKRGLCVDGLGEGPLFSIIASHSIASLIFDCMNIVEKLIGFGFGFGIAGEAMREATIYRKKEAERPSIHACCSFLPVY